MASVYNPSVNQGIDLIFTITWTDSTGTAINLTGYTIKLAITNQVTNANLLTLQIGSGVTVATPTSGVAQFQITGTQTTALGVGTYFYGVKATSAGGINYDWLDGTITIAQARV
jgi:hypothetical protein